jgi:uncharacterized protein involved in exopolysaccharide biosynthesis
MASATAVERAMNHPFEPDVSFNQNTSELDLRALGRAIRRKKHWIIWPTLATFVLVGLYVTLTKPTYTATAQVLLENQESFLPRPLRNDGPSSESTTFDAESVGSQVQLVTSRDIARRASTSSEIPNLIRSRRALVRSPGL